MTATAGPAILDALIALCSGAVGQDVEVVDGYTHSEGNAAQLVIGVSEQNDDALPAVVSEQLPLDGYGAGRQELLTVVCRLSAYPTSTLKDARDFLLAVLNDIDGALRADRRLGGAASEAHLGAAFELSQADGPSGDRLRYDFTISATALL